MHFYGTQNESRHVGREIESEHEHKYISSKDNYETHLFKFPIVE